MRKFIIVSGIYILSVAIIIMTLFTGCMFSTVVAPSGTAAAAASPDVKIAELTPSPSAMATERPSPSPKIETGLVKPENFTEGVWIKKYPGNYACFKFETPDGIKIVTDPYEMNELVYPDIVTESHQHGDHTDTSDLRGDYKLITWKGSYDVKGIKITGFPGMHDKGDIGITNTISLFEIGGIRIAHFASQGELPDKKTLHAIGRVDILLIQVFDPPISNKLNLKDCRQIFDVLQPKIVIPEHGTQELIGPALSSYFNIPDEYASTGEICVTKHDLENIQGMKVINLYTQS